MSRSYNSYISNIRNLKIAFLLILKITYFIKITFTFYTMLFRAREYK